jgi:hypothetical protein
MVECFVGLRYADGLLGWVVDCYGGEAHGREGVRERVVIVVVSMLIGLVAAFEWCGLYTEERCSFVSNDMRV